MSAHDGGGQSLRSPGDSRRESLQDATDHLTLALFPLATMNDPDERTVIDYHTETKTPQGTLHQRWTVRAPSGQKLPTPDDMTFLLGLLMLGHQDDFRIPTVHFTPNQLFRMLRISAAPDSYQRLKEALGRLAGVYIQAENAVYATGGKWESLEGFHLIDRFQIRDGRLRGNDGKQTSFVRWGEAFWLTLQRGDVRPLDLQLYLDLKRPTTRVLFRLLEHYRGSGRREVRFDAEDLSARIGMIMPKHASELNRRLKPAHDQLLAAGVISEVTYARGQFVYRLADPIRAEVHDTLLRLGFTSPVAADLLLRHGPVKIICQLDGLRFGQNRAERVPAFLVAALRDGYEIRYHADEPQTVTALLAFQPPDVQQNLWRRARLISGIADEDITCPLEYPEMWPLEMRCVLRYLISPPTPENLQGL